MEEIWKDIPGYDGYYQVSDCGNVRSWKRNRWGKSKKPRVLSQHQESNNRCRVDLMSDEGRRNHKVHRLVAEAFIPNPKDKPQINHIDGDQSNNHASNLEWCTYQENRDHAVETGLHAVGEECTKAGLCDNDIIDMRNAYRIGCFSCREIGEAWDISTKQAWNIVNKRQWAHV